MLIFAIDICEVGEPMGLISAWRLSTTGLGLAAEKTSSALYSWASGFWLGWAALDPAVRGGVHLCY